jgi:hypothetical protein
MPNVQIGTTSGNTNRNNVRQIQTEFSLKRKTTKAGREIITFRAHFQPIGQYDDK